MLSKNAPRMLNGILLLGQVYKKQGLHDQMLLGNAVYNIHHGLTELEMHASL